MHCHIAGASLDYLSSSCACHAVSLNMLFELHCLVAMVIIAMYCTAIVQLASCDAARSEAVFNMSQNQHCTFINAVTDNLHKHILCLWRYKCLELLVS